MSGLNLKTGGLLIVLFAAGLAVGAWLFSNRDAGPAKPAGSGMEAAEAAYADGDMETTFSILLPMAEAGEGLAQHRVGLMYAKAMGVERDVEKAIEWLKKAVAQDVSPAGPLLGELYVEKAQAAASPEAGADWYHRAAVLGVPDAQAVYGSYLLAGGAGVEKDSAQALQLLTLAGDAGDPRAMTNLGYMYATGTGVEQNYATAADWYLKSADAGMVRAQSALASLYETGNGVEQDIPEAVRWYISAAAAGDESAAARLGLLIGSGQLVPPEPDPAVAWVQIAAAKGDSDALTWLQQTADSGSALAKGALGDLHVAGLGVPQDSSQAVTLYQQAAEAGDVASQLALGRLYGTGEGVEQNYVLAHQWVNLAAASGNAEAIEARTVFAQLMTAEQIEQAQDLAREWTRRQQESTQ